MDDRSGGVGRCGEFLRQFVHERHNRSGRTMILILSNTLLLLDLFELELTAIQRILICLWEGLWWRDSLGDVTDV